MIRPCYQHISHRLLRPRLAHLHPPPLLSLLPYQRQYASQRLPNVHRECRPQRGRPQAGVYRANTRISRPPHLIVSLERENRLGEQGEGIHCRLPERRPQPRSPRPVRLCCFRDPQAAHWEGPQGLGADRPERGNVRGGRRSSRQILGTTQQQRHSGQHAPLPGLCHCNSRHASRSIRQVSKPPKGPSTRGRRQRTVCRVLWSTRILDPPDGRLSSARLWRPTGPDFATDDHRSLLANNPVPPACIPLPQPSERTRQSCRQPCRKPSHSQSHGL